MRIYSHIKSTKALGPYDRFALWVQGCPFSCGGCMTPDSQNFTGGEEIAVELIADLILSSTNIEGITITGGEPFMQSVALVQLLKLLKSKRELGVIVYSGFTIEQLKARNEIAINEFLSYIDILIDGQYVEVLNDGKALKGSSNQVVHQLTYRYKNVFDNYYDRNTRGIELHMNQKNMMLVGIPSKYTLNKIP